MSFSGVNENFILCTHPLPSTSSSTLLPPIVSTIAYSNPQANKQDPRLCVVAGGIGLGVYNVSQVSHTHLNSSIVWRKEEKTGKGKKRKN